jgi:hypothetical protein
MRVFSHRRIVGSPTDRGGIAKLDMAFALGGGGLTRARDFLTFIFFNEPAWV